MPEISHKTWKAFKPFLERGIQTELFASESEQWVTITDKDNNLWLMNSQLWSPPKGLY